VETLSGRELGRLGSVQPIRHARTASHRESPALSVDLNDLIGERIVDSLYPSSREDNDVGEWAARYGGWRTHPLHSRQI
jgi:hypothetical protein